MHGGDGGKEEGERGGKRGEGRKKIRRFFRIGRTDTIIVAKAKVPRLPPFSGRAVIFPREIRHLRLRRAQKRGGGGGGGGGKIH